MTKISNFEKIITEITSLKSEFLNFGNLVVCCESLDKINKNLGEINLELTIFLSSYDFLALELSHFWLQNQYILGTNSQSREKNLVKKWQNLLQNLQKLTTKLKTELEVELNPNLQKNLEFKLENNLETKEKLNLEQDLKTKLKTQNTKQTENLDFEKESKITEKLENETQIELTNTRPVVGTSLKRETLQVGHSLKNNLKIQLIQKIITIADQIDAKINGKIDEINHQKPPKFTFHYQKNLIEISVLRESWNLQTHFEKLLSENSDLVIEANLEKTDFDELLVICGIEKTLQNVDKICAENNPKTALIGQKLFEKIHAKNKYKTQIQKGNPNPNLIQNTNSTQNLIQNNSQIQTEKNKENGEIEKNKLENSSEKNSNNWQIQNTKSEFETGKVGNSEQENEENADNCDNFVQSLNLEIFLSQKLKEIKDWKINSQNIKKTAEKFDIKSEGKDQEKSIIAIICGQNSTLRDANQIINSAKFEKSFLILGESGSLTKIASKIEEFSGFLIVKNNDFLQLLQNSDLKNKVKEVWFINQPYLRLDSWSPIYMGKLKQFYLQSQINYLQKTCNCEVYFVKTYTN